MAALLTDGDPGGAPDPARVELLGTDDLAADDAAGTGAAHRTRARAVVLGVTGLVAMLLLGAGVQAWDRDRVAAGTADLVVQGSRLHLASFQLPSVEVTVRNAGPRVLLLERLDGAGGAVRPQAGVLPLPVPPRGQVQVRLRFGDRCARSTTDGLVATVRTAAGTQRSLPLALPGSESLQFVRAAVRAACGPET